VKIIETEMIQTDQDIEEDKDDMMHTQTKLDIETDKLIEIEIEKEIGNEHMQ